MADVNRVVARHRRLVALLIVLVVCGVTALSAHASLCGCDDAACAACLCVTTGAIAAVAGVGWSQGREPRVGASMIRVRLLPAPAQMVTSAPRSSARAGPGALAVLRL
jgi:hypothetical protein